MKDVEVGYARALGKRITLATNEQGFAEWDDHTSRDRNCACTGGHGCTTSSRVQDLWFVRQTANLQAIADTAAEAFAIAYEDHAMSAVLESPLEVLFWDHWVRAGKPIPGLVAQHNVTANGNRYRLDFALPDRKIAYEMDGRTYHNTDKAFNHDRRRDLDLSLEGWRVHRFDGDLIRNDPAGVVRTAVRLA